MKGHLYLVHWNAIEAEQRSSALRADGWDVSTEPEDPGRAYEFVKREQPDLLVIDLSFAQARAWAQSRAQCAPGGRARRGADRICGWRPPGT